MKRNSVLAGAAVLMILAAGPGLAVDAGAPLDVAQYARNGDLRRPADLEAWQLLGVSLGMGYSDAEFDADNPGMFQVVLMEPAAYASFLESGSFADGSMFALMFYGTNKRFSINRVGFVQDELHNFEIHVKDAARYDEDRAFFIFDAGDKSASIVPPGSECVSCHQADGAFDGVFAQFYPAMRHLIPAENLKRALDKERHE